MKSWSSADDKPSPLMPHAFKTAISFLDAPISISILPGALKDIQVIINECDDEISWMGSVKRVNSGHFQIKKVYLIKQKVSGCDTDIDERAFGDLVMKLRKEEGVEAVNSLKFWGHSHVFMDTFASGQDDEMLDWFVKFIKAIIPFSR